jgi:hypothetical protein
VIGAPTVDEIAEAIGAALEPTGIRFLPYLSDTFSPPIALVAIELIDYHGAFGGGDVLHTFTVFVIVARSSDRAGIAALEGYLSQGGNATSIQGALEADPTLGDLVNAATVRKAGPPTNITVNGAVYISCPFTVEVHA